MQVPYHGRYLPSRDNRRKEEDALLGTAPDPEISKQLKRSHATVAARRRELGIRSYKRGRRIRFNDRGYALVPVAADDPMSAMANGTGYVLEHRLVMARSLGRPLRQDEFAHHRNGIKNDNRPENLELWTRAHPDGQRVSDIFQWCVEFIERYADAMHGPVTPIPDRSASIRWLPD